MKFIKTSNMKILLVNNLYRPFSRGGAEKLVELMADEFAKSGHQVEVLTSLPLGTAKPADNSQVRYLPGLSRVFARLDKLPTVVRLLVHLLGCLDPVA